MNENLDLCLILKDCPKDAKLYCTFLGDVLFSKIEDNKIFVHTNYAVYSFYSDGKFTCDSECVLFPSREQRDWSMFKRFWDQPKVEKFDPNTFQPFDKVLVRTELKGVWNIDLFGYKKGPFAVCLDTAINDCIPFNNEAKHLLGTNDDCPEYYKWWEE